MPFMEGKFSADAGPDDDQSMDPVGLVSAVHVLAIVFKGCTLEEEELREKIAKGELLDFSLVQIALFATVVSFEGGRRVLLADRQPVAHASCCCPARTIRRSRTRSSLSAVEQRPQSAASTTRSGAAAAVGCWQR
jgi:hypothetical protein